MIQTQAFIQELHGLMWQEWSEVIKTNPLMRAAMNGTGDKRLFAIYLSQVYHFTRENPVNQALVAQNLQSHRWKMDTGTKVRYMKFCFHHAEEEAGHEYMALHDLKAFGLDVEEATIPPALPSTSAFIALVSEIATQWHPAARLGYSYWAESCYEIFRPIAGDLQSSLGIKPQAMTFLHQHGQIDEKHAEEVNVVLGYVVTNEEAAASVKRALIETIRSTGEILAQIHQAYVELKADPEKSPYSLMARLG